MSRPPWSTDVTIMIDNYDSFTYNVVQYLSQLGARVATFRNDKVTIEELEALSPARIVLSPGPGAPADAGVCNDVIRHFAGRIPILGVCLGYQCMFEVYGGTVGRAPEVLHGKASPITHDGKGLFEGLPSPYKVVRYHSLAADVSTTPDCLEITAEADSGVAQALRHKTLPCVAGVQFHPESIVTEHGLKLFTNFLRWKVPPRR